MARRRFQTGCLFKRGKRSKVWVARWRETVIQPGGSFRRVQRSEVRARLQASRRSAKPWIHLHGDSERSTKEHPGPGPLTRSLNLRTNGREANWPPIALQPASSTEQYSSDT